MFYYEKGLVFLVYISDQKFGNKWICCLWLIKKSHIMCISGILADACFTKQRAKPKDTFAGVIYSVLLVKMC